MNDFTEWEGARNKKLVMPDTKFSYMGGWVYKVNGGLEVGLDML